MSFFAVQVSKTDPSPKREMPTMILFNVVFALRVRLPGKKYYLTVLVRQPAVEPLLGSTFLVTSLAFIGKGITLPRLD